MPELSGRSEKNLRTCHPDLQRVFRQVARDEAIEIIYGHRDRAAQEIAFKSGVTKLRWPLSKHNLLPAEAVDVVPLPINWDDINAFVQLSAKIKAVASELGVRLRWGADWDSDGKTEKGEWDYPHWELVRPRRIVTPPRPPVPGSDM